MKKKKNNYVDNKKMFNEIVKYRQKLKETREKGLPDPKIPDYIGKCIIQIAENVSTKSMFLNYSFRDEMIADGIENCIMYFDRFDPDKSNNPFAYFTQIINNAFWRRRAKEEKLRYLKYKFFQEEFVNTGGASLLVDSNDKQLMTISNYDNIQSFMDNFEEKEQIKKEKKKEAKKKKEEENESLRDSISNSTIDRTDVET